MLLCIIVLTEKTSKFPQPIIFWVLVFSCHKMTLITKITWMPLQYYIGGGVSRDPQKWLRNMCTTPNHCLKTKQKWPNISYRNYLSSCLIESTQKMKSNLQLKCPYNTAKCINSYQLHRRNSFSSHQTNPYKSFDQWNHYINHIEINM